MIPTASTVFGARSRAEVSGFSIPESPFSLRLCFSLGKIWLELKLIFPPEANGGDGDSTGDFGNGGIAGEATRGSEEGSEGDIF